MAYVYLDFEYYNSSEEYVTPVCGVIKVGGEVYPYWLYDSAQSRNAMREHIAALHAAGHIFVSYAFEAEARSMQAIGFDPLRANIRCLCLYILYRQLANAFDDIEYGDHLVDGKVVKLRKPKSKWHHGDEEAEEEESSIKKSNSKMQYGLASATYKFTHNIRDTEDKDACRDRILKGGPFSAEDKEWILNYCAEDVKFLPELHQKMWAQYQSSIGLPEYKMLDMSFYSVRTAEMVRIGYPASREWLAKITAHVPVLLRDLQRNLLQQAKEVGLPFPPFTWVRGTGEFKENKKLIQDYVAATYPHAKRTESGNISLDEEAVEYLRTPPHLPMQFIDYYRKYSKAKKGLYGFKPAANKRTIWDSYGSDERLRPYFGIFGSQTSRSQPSSTGFVFLKSKMLRFLVHPKPGKVLFGIDYSSEEYLINAILAGDQNMISAYASGDVYLYLGKNIGVVPKDGVRKDYEPQRKMCKELELALSFGMGAASASLRVGVSEDMARELMAARAELYSDFTEYRRGIVQEYLNNILMLADGWALGPDQPNRLSVQNFPTQGAGAVVLRYAVKLCQEAGLRVIFTLHDAIYFECELRELEAIIIKAHHLMILAFQHIMQFPTAPIRAEIHAWGLPIAERETRNIGGHKVICDGTYFEGDAGEISKHYEWVSFVRNNQDIL